MKTIKYIPDRKTLIALNNAAIRANRNRTMIPEKITRLPTKTRFPISWAIPHNDTGEIRCWVVLTAEGIGALLDMDISTYEVLPEMEIPDD